MPRIQLLKDLGSSGAYATIAVIEQSCVFVRVRHGSFSPRSTRSDCQLVVPPLAGLSLPNLSLISSPQSHFSLLRHRVGHLDLARHNLFLGCLDLIDDRLWYQAPIIVVQGIANAIVVQPEQMNAAAEVALNHFLHRIVNRDVDSLSHARQDEARLNPILIRIDSDCQPSRLLDRIENTKPGIPGCLEYHIGPSFYLGLGQLFPLAWIVPG